MNKPAHKIGIFLEIPGLAKSRIIAGFFRFARKCPNWQIYQFPVQSDSTELQRITSDFKPDAILSGHPDVIRAYAHGKSRSPVYVLMENVEPGFPTQRGAAINIDNKSIGKFAANRLMTLGYRNLAYFGPFMSTTHSSTIHMLSRYSSLRQGGFERVARESGFAVHSLAQATSKPLTKKTTSKWLVDLPKPCGILCFSDDEAQWLTRNCAELGINVPREIGILGIDNEEHVCENASPPISSIEPDYEQAGFLAGDLIARLLAKDPTVKGYEQEYGILKLENRLSVQSLSASGKRVSLALSIATRNLTKCPSPSVIAADLGISPRVLELAFKKTLGHGFTTEILNRKLEKAKELLSTTQAPISEVARSCGFGNYPAFKVAFRRRFNISARDWRKLQSQG